MSPPKLGYFLAQRRVVHNSHLNGTLIVVLKVLKRRLNGRIAIRHRRKLGTEELAVPFKLLKVGKIGIVLNRHGLYLVARYTI